MLSLWKFCMDIYRTDCLSMERLKCASLEEICNIDNAKRISKVRLVWTKLKHCLFVADDRIWCLCNFISLRCKFLKCCREDFLTNLKYIFLCCKAHLKIELVELSRWTVCSRILISETRCYLEILVKTWHHKKLLVLLWCLWQCIKFTFEFAWWHDIISCTLRWWSTKDRCLNF